MHVHGGKGGYYPIGEQFGHYADSWKVYYP